MSIIYLCIDYIFYQTQVMSVFIIFLFTVSNKIKINSSFCFIVVLNYISNSCIYVIYVDPQSISIFILHFIEMFPNGYEIIK